MSKCNRPFFPTLVLTQLSKSLTTNLNLNLSQQENLWLNGIKIVISFFDRKTSRFIPRVETFICVFILSEKLIYPRARSQPPLYGKCSFLSDPHHAVLVAILFFLPQVIASYFFMEYQLYNLNLITWTYEINTLSAQYIELWQWLKTLTKLARSVYKLEGYSGSFNNQGHMPGG